jgi:hypothetical protein
VSKIRAGGSHSCALKTSGDLECWGDNSWGQVGDDTSGNTRTTPVDAEIDSDGDGCPDADEPNLVPPRNPKNPFDYKEQNNDGLIRVQDILDVVDHYFYSYPDSGYNEKYDLTGQLGVPMPDGTIRVVDILAVVKSYFDDCGTGLLK